MLWHIKYLSNNLLFQLIFEFPKYGSTDTEHMNWVCYNHLIFREHASASRSKNNIPSHKINQVQPMKILLIKE